MPDPRPIHPVPAAVGKVMSLTVDRYSVNTATLGYQAPISELIDAIARHGFGGISPWRREVEGNVSAVARRIRDAGLEVSGYCRSAFFPGKSREEWLANIEENRHALRDAAELRAKCFVLVVGSLPAGSRDIDEARQQVEHGIAALMPDAADLGVPLAIEPLHPMYAADRACVNTIAHALDLCNAIDSGNTGVLGVAIDVYHTWWDANLSAMIARAGRENRFLAFHVNDWLVPTADMLMDRGLMGEGAINLGQITKQVMNSGYKGLHEIEVFSNRVWKWPVDDILSECSRRCNNIV